MAVMTAALADVAASIANGAAIRIKVLIIVFPSISMYASCPSPPDTQSGVRRLACDAKQ